MFKTEAVTDDFGAFRCYQKQGVIVREDSMKRRPEQSLLDLEGSG